MHRVLGRVTDRFDGVPLRAKLVALLMLLIVAPLAGTGYVVQEQMRTYLVDLLDDRLSTNFSDAVAGAISPNLSPFGGQRVSYEYVVQWVQVSTATGETTDGGTEQSSTGTSTPDLPALTASQVDVGSARHDPEFYTVGSASGSGTWRVLQQQVLLQEQGGTSVILAQVALPTAQAVDAPVQQVRLLVFGVGLMATSLAALVGWAAIRRSFRPLQQIERTAAEIAAGDLSRRAPWQPPGTEVGSLTASLNAMLTHIERAFRAQEASEARTRRFAADASHELRTPLASIRGFAELFRQGAVPPSEVPRTMRRIEDEATRMGGLVEDLLLLARLDAQRPGRSEPVDLLVIAGDAAHDVRGLDPLRQVRLVGAEGPSPRPAVVTGDEDRLRQVVANLIGNAVRHTPAGTPIEIAVGECLVDGERRAVFEVRDHGPGLSPEQAAKVFERFYRVDSSRWRGQGGGSGLGLSIVSAVVGAHHGRIQVRDTPGGGATFAFDLPSRQEHEVDTSPSGSTTLHG